MLGEYLLEDDCVAPVVHLVPSGSCRIWGDEQVPELAVRSVSKPGAQRWGEAADPAREGESTWAGVETRAGRGWTSGSVAPVPPAPQLPRTQRLQTPRVFLMCFKAPCQLNGCFDMSHLIT